MSVTLPNWIKVDNAVGDLSHRLSTQLMSGIGEQKQPSPARNGKEAALEEFEC